MSPRIKTILWRILPTILLIALFDDSVRAEVIPTNEWVNFYSIHTTFNGDPVPVGAVVDAYDSSGVPCGTYTVSRPGQYGFLVVYRDDPQTPVDEGAAPGERVTFKINGYVASVVSGDPRWTKNGDVIELDLIATDGTVPYLTRFTVQAPSTVPPNTPFTVRITAIDQRGKVLTSFAGPVYLSAAGSGVLSPTTISGFLNGIAEADVIYTRAEAIYLRATDGSGTVSSGTYIVVTGVAVTNEWVSFFGEKSLFNGQPVPAGAVIDAYDPDGVRCGTYTVAETGKYGFMPVYRDDPQTPVDEGAAPGDPLSFKINGFPAVVLSGGPVWTENGAVEKLELSATDGVTRYLHRFSLSAPYYVRLNTAFGITIRALDQRGDLFSAFSGPAYLSTTGSGSISPSVVENFVGGVATVDAVYDVPEDMRIVVRNQEGTASGVSGYLHVTGVAVTNEWVSFFSQNSTFNGKPLQSGWNAAVIDAYDPDGVRCGTYTVAETGKYGFMPVYRDDPQTPVDEGAVPGDTISFKINGYDAQVARGLPVWTENGEVIELDLDATDGVSPYLSYFHVQAPSHAAASTPFPITITAIDQRNEVFTGFSGSVVLTTTGTGIITPTRVSSFVNGVARVDVLYDVTERIRITATLQYGTRSGTSPYITVGVPRTNRWVSFYSANTIFQDRPVPVGAIIDAYDPQGRHCGTFRVETEGSYGFMPVYWDDPTTSQDEGASLGDTISFEINGYAAVATGDPPVWTGNGDVWNVDLNASTLHPPVLSGLSDTLFAEDDALVLDLDDYVEDLQDPDADLTWSVTGNIHISVSINLTTHNAVFRAPANWNGTETMTFTVTDPLSSQDSATIAVTVTPVNDLPTITSAPDTTAVVGVPYVYQVQAHDVDAGDVLTFSLTRAPEGMHIDPGTGGITWTPMLYDVGTDTVTIHVEDRAFASDDQTYRLLITETAVPPHVISTVPAAGAIGVPRGTEVSAEFDRDIDGITVNDTTFLVHGALSGPHRGVVDYLEIERTAIFIPYAPFLEGEVVTATLTNAIRSADGDTLQGYTWHFTVGIPPKFEISGKLVYYADTTAGIRDVRVILSGDASDTVLTDNDGFYRFRKMTPGNYAVTPEKRGDIGERTISAFDASIVLRYRVGILPLGPEQVIAAEVTGDGAVSAYDAAYILRRVVGALDSFPSGDWAFVPDRVAYEPLSSDRTHENYVGIVYGDVSGNWPGVVPASRYIAGAARGVTLRDISVPSGSLLVLSVGVDDAEGILSAAMTIRYNPEELRVSEVRTTEMTSDYSMAHNGLDGKLNIAIAGSRPLEGSGALVKIAFEGVKGENPRSGTIQLLDVQLNEGSIPVTVEGTCLKRIPEEVVLFQNYPNPFNPETTIRYSLPEAGDVRLRIYTLSGQKVRTLVDGYRTSGRFSMVWDGRDDTGKGVASGIYLCRMEEAGGHSTVRKMLLVR